MRIHTDENGSYVNSISSLSDGTDVNGHMYQTSFGCQTYTLLFQSGPVKEAGVNGLTNEALLAILIHRTETLNEKFPCEENELAINRMKEALEAFNQRTANRKARGVNDTHIV